MATIAIITARGGSKRIPQKNIKNFCGKPIMAYSIEAALESGCFDTVMVSTDSEEIAQIAVQYGAEVPFLRSEKTSDDFATTNDVLTEVLERYAANGKNYDIMACIYPTAPFVTPERLKEAQKMIDDGARSVMAATQYSYPPQRGLVLRDGKMVYREEKYQFARSQDLEPIFHDAGQFYFYKLQNNVEFVDGNYSAVVLDDIEVQDIDNMSDWKIAELKYNLIHNLGE